MRRTESRLVIESEQPLWELQYNTINAPVDWHDDAEKRWQELKKTTAAVHGRFVFSIEPRWSKQKTREAKEKNAEAVANARRAAPRTSSVPSKAAWADARARDAQLERQLTKLPYNTQRYSLFLVESTGVESEYTVVFPERAAQDGYAVESLVLRALEHAP
jgi:hypothetical protein